jgi:tripartite-type tricarboxylate transporter receptor subunit TctC
MRLTLVSLGLISMLTPVAGAFAQEYPARPIRILTAEPGGGNDFLSRIVATPLAAALNQQVIVENRASATVGPLGAVANPDGYTLVVGGGTFQSVPLTINNPGYDPVKSFAGVSQLERSPNVLVVNVSLGVNSVKELIALAKAKPGALNYGSGGSGGSLHQGAEMFRLATGVDIRRVPYKSTGPALIGLLGNEVQLIFSTPPGAMAHVKAGKLRALAVTSVEPTPLVPGVPTMIASGVPGFELDTIGFILAPLKTPAPVIRKLNQEIVRIIASPEVKAQLFAGGSEAISSTPEGITAKLAADDARLRKLFAAIGIVKQ